MINLEYDQSKEGNHLKQLDEDSKVRALMRSKNIDVRSNCGYNVLTGSDRSQIDIPANAKYNPYNPQATAGHHVVHGSNPPTPQRSAPFATADNSGANYQQPPQP